MVKYLEKEHNDGGLVRWLVHFLLLVVHFLLFFQGLCGDCLECHQSKKSRDVELLLPHENCIARLFAQTGRGIEEISCFAKLAKWNGKHAI
jgi:hypothetical protein